jgi:hypothetical protein
MIVLLDLMNICIYYFKLRIPYDYKIFIDIKKNFFKDGDKINIIIDFINYKIKFLKNNIFLKDFSISSTNFEIYYVKFIIIFNFII